MISTKSKKLMGTEITITIFWWKECIEDIENVFSIFYSLELEFSRFLPDSSLSKLNFKKTLQVSDRFIDILRKSKDIYIETDCYFNPLINLKKIWYSSDFYSNNFRKEDEILQTNLDIDSIEILWNTITLQKWQQLDLWGIVKWFWVDIAKKYLDNKGYINYIIDAGWDIYTSWLNDMWGKILVGIDSPFNKDNILATLEVENKAIATSGSYRRKWRIDLGLWKWGQEYNHIINPITHTNNNEIVSITLIDNDCCTIDAYATACIAMWLEKSLSFLKKNNIDCVIVCSNKKIYTRWTNKYNINYI